jgi:hypothetical protein
MPVAGRARVNRVVTVHSARAVARPPTAEAPMRSDAAVGRAGWVQREGSIPGGTAGDAPWQWVNESREVTGMTAVLDGRVRRGGG